jgi:NhaA family Na+:H+ antiporter
MPGEIPKLAPAEVARLRRLARVLVQPLERFLRIEGASGIVLLVAAIAALVWANSRWAPSYVGFWDRARQLGTSEVTPRFVVNDVLMTSFFLVAGLELRRERYAGELSERRRAILPVFAALGGMIVPALIYLALNRGEASRGWAVPTATDLAFAIGVLSLLGRRVPGSLRVFLLALAIIDDLGAIVIVAVFYARDLEPSGFALALVGVAGILGLQRLNVGRPGAYVAPVVVIWAGLEGAGIHPALAGVIAGLMTPMGRGPWSGSTVEADAVASPVVRLESALHPWVAFGVMPLFALANAGVDLHGLHGGASIVAGIVTGLVIGKPLGVVAASAIAVKLGLAALPRGATWRGVALVGAVAGIGFTMALFTAELAFADRPELHAVARVALLAGSGIALVITLVYGRIARLQQAPQDVL